MDKIFKLFAATAIGLEEMLLSEMQNHSYKDLRIDAGGVWFKGGMRDIVKANLEIAIASRILIHLKDFGCPDGDALYSEAKKYDWAPWFGPAYTFSVKASSYKNSAFSNSMFAALRTKDGICDAFRKNTGKRPDIDRTNPDITIHARIIGNSGRFFIDTSGRSLHVRGFRDETAAAPLNENTASAINVFSNWNPKTELFYDTMCGSGTMAIEAALRLSGMAPGLSREIFSFKKLPMYNREDFSSIKDELLSKVIDIESSPKIFASDLGEKTLQTAKQNAKNAGVDKFIDFKCSNFRDIRPLEDSTGVFFCNPPYGIRLGHEEELMPLYTDIGDNLKANWKGYRAYVLTGNMNLAKKVGLRTTRKLPIKSGGIDCRLLFFEIFKGTRKDMIIEKYEK